MSQNQALTNLSGVVFSNYSGEVNDYNVHYYYFYVHPFATWLATLTNFMCVVVFAQKELLSKGPFFQYSLVNSLGAGIGI